MVDTWCAHVLQLEVLSVCVATTTDQRLLTTLLTSLQRRYVPYMCHACVIARQLLKVTDHLCLSIYRTDNKFDRLMGSKVVELLTSKLDVVGVGYLLDTYHQLLIGALDTGGSHTIAANGWVVLLPQCALNLRSRS